MVTDWASILLRSTSYLLQWVSFSRLVLGDFAENRLEFESEDDPLSVAADWIAVPCPAWVAVAQENPSTWRSTPERRLSVETNVRRVHARRLTIGDGPKATVTTEIHEQEREVSWLTNGGQ